MHIEHVAIWTRDLERLRAFYEQHLGATSGARYDSASHPGFSSYFLRFPEGGARLELMTVPGLGDRAAPVAAGFVHLALAVGSREDVDALTGSMRERGVAVVSDPRLTGDGYYEAVVQDPDGNLIELTAASGAPARG